jgi:hypothetical protein
MSIVISIVAMGKYDVSEAHEAREGHKHGQISPDF